MKLLRLRETCLKGRCFKGTFFYELDILLKIKHEKLDMLNFKCMIELYK